MPESCHPGSGDPGHRPHDVSLSNSCQKSSQMTQIQENPKVRGESNMPRTSWASASVHDAMGPTPLLVTAWNQMPGVITKKGIAAGRTGRYRVSTLREEPTHA